MNNDPRIGSLGMTNNQIRDNYYNNGPTPAIFSENSKDKCLFKRPPNPNVVNDNSIDYKNQDFDLETEMGNYFTKQEFINKPLIHQNIQANVLSEFIKENTMVIDSLDRNVTRWPNAFNFRVKFNPSSTDKGPVILKNFENVRYIRLERAILPDCHRLKKVSVSGGGAVETAFVGLALAYPADTDEENETGIYNFVVICDIKVGAVRTIDFVDLNDYLGINKVYSMKLNEAGDTCRSLVYYTCSSNHKISEDRFTQLHIEEINRVNEQSTNSLIRKSFALLYTDKSTNNYVYADTMNADNIYKFSKLGNISSLTIKMYTSTGATLSTASEYTNDNITNATSKDDLFTKPLAGEDAMVKYVSASRYIRHPLYIKNQCHFVFKVGVVQSEQDKMIFN